MDPKTNYDLQQCKILADYISQVCEVISRTQRIGAPGGMGLSHTGFGPSFFGGMPVQGMPVVDPRGMDFGSVGLGHTPYSVYSYYPQSFGAWTNPQVGTLPTAINPFYGQLGLSHSQWPTWSPYAAELARREMFARGQYDPTWRPFGT